MAISGGDGSIILNTKVDTKGLNSGLNSMKGAITKIGGLLAAAFSVKMLINFAKESRNLYKIQMQNEVKLATVMRQRMKATDDEIKSMLELASAQQQIGIIGDEVQLAGLQQIATFAKHKESIEALLPAMNNLIAQQYGFEASTESARNVANLMGKALQGQTGALTRVGITFDATEEAMLKTGNEMERAAALAKIITNNVGEMNYALAQTDVGRQQQLANTWGDIKEQFGAAFQQIAIIALPALNAVAKALAFVANIARTVAQAIANIFGKKLTGWQDLQTQGAGVASSMEDATDAVSGLGDAAKGAGKEAKKSLAAFDDLNIVSENSSAGGGGGGGAGGISGGIGGAGDVSSEMSIVPEDDTQITFLDEILGKLQSIKEIFMSGFWQGFQNADFSGIEQSISGIKESLIGIYTSPEVQTAAQGFVSSVVLAFGQITGSIASIGTTIATNLLGGFNQYLQTNAPFIQTSIAKVYDASSGIATSIGNMWAAFANIFSAYASTNGQTLTANIIGIFANAVYGVATLITQFANDFIKFLTKPIIDNQDGLKTVLDGLLGFFAEMFGGIKTLLDTLVQNVLTLYEDRISPFIQMLTDIVSEWVAKFVEAYNVYIQPVLEQFAQKFQEVVEQYLAPMFEKIFEFIGKTVDLVMPLWEGVLKPLVSWLIDVFANTFSEVFGRIGDIVTDAFKLISGLISGIMDILGGIIDFIVGVFSGDWKRAWEGLVGIFKGIINIIISVFEGMINLIINAVNLFVSALDVVVSGVGDLVGQDWNIPKIPTVSIPRLAKGAVIPPNREFLAVLGDQKQGTNIEAPLQTIVDAFNIALAQNGGAGGRNTEVILEVDGREFGRAVVEQGNRENRRIGTRLVTV